MKKKMKNDEKFFRMMDTMFFSNLISSFTDYSKEKDFYIWLTAFAFGLVLFAVILIATIL